MMNTNIEDPTVIPDWKQYWYAKAPQYFPASNEIIVLVDGNNAIAACKGMNEDDMVRHVRQLLQQCIDTLQREVDDALQQGHCDKKPKLVVVVVIDRGSVRSTWRKRIIENIDKQRPKVECTETHEDTETDYIPKQRQQQIQILEKVFTSWTSKPDEISFCHLFARRMEADDIIALLTFACSGRTRIAIFSNDRDYHTLLKMHRPSLRMFQLDGTEKTRTDTTRYEVSKFLYGCCSKKIPNAIINEVVRWDHTPANEHLHTFVKTIAQAIARAKVDGGALTLGLKETYVLRLPREGKSPEERVITMRDVLERYYRVNRIAMDVEYIEHRNRVDGWFQILPFVPEEIKKHLPASYRARIEALLAEAEPRRRPLVKNLHRIGPPLRQDVRVRFCFRALPPTRVFSTPYAARKRQQIMLRTNR